MWSRLHKRGPTHHAFELVGLHFAQAQLESFYRGEIVPGTAHGSGHFEKGSGNLAATMASLPAPHPMDFASSLPMFTILAPRPAGPVTMKTQLNLSRPEQAFLRQPGSIVAGKRHAPGHTALSAKSALVLLVKLTSIQGSDSLYFRL